VGGDEPDGGRVSEEEAGLLAVRVSWFVLAAAIENGSAPGRQPSVEVVLGRKILTWASEVDAGAVLYSFAELAADPESTPARRAVILAMRHWLVSRPDLAAKVRQLLGQTVNITADRDAFVAGRDINILLPQLTDSQVELVRVKVVPPDRVASEGGTRDASPVLEVLVRNIGGQTAVLKRVNIHVRRALRYGAYFGSMRLTPFRGIWVGATLPVSATYNVAVPPPEAADHLTIPVNITEQFFAGSADSFWIRLGMVPTFDAYAYLMQVELAYNEDGRTVISKPVAVSFSGGSFVFSATDIGGQVKEFLEGVQGIRDAIDQEVTGRGLPAPDWGSARPRDRNDLPPGLLSVDGNGNLMSSGGRGVYEVTEEFWNPELAVARHLNAFHRAYRELADIIDSADEVDEKLLRQKTRLREILRDFPRLYAQFRVPYAPAHPGALLGGIADDGEQPSPPAALLLGMVRGENDGGELRNRMDSDDPETIRFLDGLTEGGHSLGGWLRYIRQDNAPNVVPVLQLLDTFLQTRVQSEPETFEMRRTLAEQIEAKDKAVGVLALRRLLDDVVLAWGPEHLSTCSFRQQIGEHLMDGGEWAAAVPVLAEVVACHQYDSREGLRARHDYAFCLGESGDIMAAISELDELVDDIRRVEGIDAPAMIAARHELARRHGENGDPQGAAIAFAELIPDANRVLGPDHRVTLKARFNLGRWHAESGDVAQATEEFREVLADQKRALGNRHADVQKTRSTLKYWRGVA
jgi:hypothetical protein